MTRPRVAIPEIHQNMVNYTRAMEAAGIDPLVVSFQSIQIEKPSQQEYIDYHEVNALSCDGLLLPGGGDINPELYGQENHGSNPVDRWLDDIQFRILEDFIRHRKPVLGICRGMQVINVWFGGSLIQDMEDASVHMHIPRDKDQVHECRVVKGSWLEKLYAESFYHNSNHHQAVCRLGNDLTVDSHCPVDDVVEALHHNSLPVYGVQWHPERMCLAHKRPDTVDGLAVFRFFCALCGGRPDREDPYADHPFRQEGIVSDGLGL